MKGDLSLKILEAIEEVPAAIGDLGYIFTLPYGTSMSRMLRELDRRRWSREGARAVMGSERRRQFNLLLYRLKRDGLVNRKTSVGGEWLSITSRGLKVLERLRKRKNVFAAEPGKYEKASDSALKIVVFDVSEKQRQKRDWLRAALVNLGFRMLQKSVWTGKVKLPEDFLRDLERANMLDCVEIFSVSKSGTLRKLE